MNIRLVRLLACSDVFVKRSAYGYKIAVQATRTQPLAAKIERPFISAGAWYQGHGVEVVVRYLAYQPNLPLGTSWFVDGIG